ncbi:hypothetical protein K458DRAFT_388170 [Lentithecium fluviatile CBS 122367]|uniref:Uncharacterized protein n=1 Tax=Lentithecium fluviatile CBS 122367 TaxID=1168545 RepID=A0A6G1J4D8_9PLEO|nr:hypothetical protein K458DRAFT_388170 [Lentithecium fluviatile CBS 122367]
MAARRGAVMYPDTAMPNIRRSATIAIFGESGTRTDTAQNVTGRATFGPVDFVDVECSIEEIPGLVIQGLNDMWYYNFTGEVTESIDIPDMPSLEYIFAFYAFNATLNNGTHYLKHRCSLRPARGSCRTAISGGIGVMKDLNCVRDSNAFGHVFEGKAWVAGAQGLPQQNNTFIAAAAGFTNRSAFVLPFELLSHVQRTLWHTSINARPRNVPAKTTGGFNDLNSTVDMTIQDERPILAIHINFAVLGIVVGVSILLGFGAILYLILVEDRT